MAVLIRGMEMPQNCFECPCMRHDSIDGMSAYQCNITLHDGIGDGRPEWCPLVEVPKHGRLIDADKLTELCDIMADKCGEIGESIWGQFRATVEWSPIIIEAEE